MTETALTKAIVKATPSDAEGERAAAVVEKAIETDPVLMNSLGQEHWWQSGIMWTGSTGVLSSIGIMFTQIGTHGFDIQQYDLGVSAGAIACLASTVGVLYRRFVPGLKPFFWRWTQK